MDRSLDSIGSCSLDVDADSSDISDTSGSLNFPTPISVKDITREFTANIRERCTLRSPLQPTAPPQPQLLRTITTTAYVNLEPSAGGVRMVLSPPTAAAVTDVVAGSSPDNCGTHSALDDVEKKPSYLNLACCVNGYSNLTTYDSKIRQDINKSREVSPIRPSTTSLQYCKRNNSLAAPLLHSMPLTKQPATAAMFVKEHNNNNNNNNNSSKNGHLANGTGDHPYCNGNASKSQGAATSSFIQQRVERLYGPGALAQGFYSPKKHGSSQSPVPRHHKSHHQRQYQEQQELDHQLLSPQNTELSRKFKQLSPSKDYAEFRKKLAMAKEHSQAEHAQADNNGDVDLPVFRHLSHEFRAQLPTVSPKRSLTRISPAPEVVLPLAHTNGTQKSTTDEVDHEPVRSTEEEYIGTTKFSATVEAKSKPAPTPETILVAAANTTPAPAPASAPTPAATAEKDGNYFLKILKDEQVRLMAQAAVAEKYIDALTNNPDITEDTFGLLRSASGKARLLATQKMKQFEGLCHNNLNRSPEDAFPTTIDDLQGFWDMVYLQVTHVDTIFADIEELKANDWKRIAKAPKAEAVTKPTKTGNQKAKSAKTTASNSVTAMKREAQRKQLLEMKRLRREALAAAVGKDQAACDGVVDDAAAAAVSVADIATESVVLQAANGDTINIAVKNSS